MRQKVSLYSSTHVNTIHPGNVVQEHRSLAETASQPSEFQFNLHLSVITPCGNVDHEDHNDYNLKFTVQWLLLGYNDGKYRMSSTSACQS